MTRDITPEVLAQLAQGFDSKPLSRVTMNTVVKNGLDAAAFDYMTDVNNPYTFSIEIKTGEITNQKRSGRCWLFAAMNMLRWHMMQNKNLETLELSQNYMMFWDKLEKANHFLNCIIDTREEEASGRLVSWLLASPVGDGGQWDMVANLIRKYGVVPKSIMPETFQSSDTGKMCWLLTRKLREDAAELRAAYAEGKCENCLYAMKDAMMAEIYSILVSSLGKPPVKFDFEYRDKDEQFHALRGVTPLEFLADFFPGSIDDYVSIISAPTADKPWHKSYTVQYLCNVADVPVRYLNLPTDEFKALALAQLSAGEPVWFGCDVGKYLGRSNGIMDLEQYRYDELLGIKLDMDKATRLDYGESLMTHAMVFLGVNVVDGKPNRWKVENSWGDESGKKGYYLMTDAWFDEYMYQLVINKKYLSEELLAEYAAEPKQLAPWDPMGSLA